jgi:hypothetical protein
MNRLLIIAVLCLFGIQEFSQRPMPYDTSTISKAEELNFSHTNKRGIHTPDGLICVVDKNLKVLSAYQQGKIK